MKSLTNLKIWLAITVISLLPFSVSLAAGIYSGGDGLTAATAYQIATATDMQEIGANSDDWGSYFELTSDIDLSGYTGTAFNIIGNDDTYFTGSFDGNGHTIGNFTYTSTGTNYIALFGWVWGGEIKDLGLTNVNVDAGTGAFVGGLVGRNYGIVSNCYVSGTVTATGSYIGGLLGMNSNSGTVSNCYAAGTVTGGSYVGGLVGRNYNTVSNCYSRSTVTAAGSNVGGLAGGDDGGSYTSCFWDKTVNAHLVGAGDGVGNITDPIEVMAKTTAEMQTQSTFTDYGWDLVSVWNVEDSQTYPLLRKYLAVDTNFDNKVDFIDFAIFTQHWLESTSP